MFVPAYRDGEKPLHEYLRAHAHQQPSRAAIIWYGRALTWAELDRLSDAFALRLLSLGVARGDRVALFMQNCPQYLIAHFGIQKIGAIVGPCGPLFKSHELQYQLQDLGARVIVCADNLHEVVAGVRADTSLLHVFTTNYADMLPAVPTIDVPDEVRVPKLRIEGATDFFEALHDTLEAPGFAAPRVDVDMDDVALLTYTSGTTGLPKGAMLTYRNALYKTACAADCNQVGTDQMMMGIAPVYHIAGMLMTIDVTTYTGNPCVMMYRFDPLAVMQAIDRYRVVFWYGMAPMNVAIMQHPRARDFDLSSLKVNLCTSFGIVLTKPLADQWTEFTGGCAIFEAAYGLSETHTMDTYMPRDAIRWGTQGKPCDGVEIRIIDPDTGEERARGELGEITARSLGTFKGYWNKPEATVKTLRDGWVHTGDMGKIDAEGYLTFVGRFKEMMKVSGYSVFPEEVEVMLIRHPAVAQAAVIGIPDATRGEVVKAVIVLKPEYRGKVESAQIIAWARENMSTYKAPREVEFRDSLPATGAGKVLRRLLKE